MREWWVKTEYGCPYGGINKMVIHARDIVSRRQELIACERKEESFALDGQEAGCVSKWKRERMRK